MALSIEFHEILLWHSQACRCYCHLSKNQRLALEISQPLWDSVVAMIEKETGPTWMLQEFCLYLQLHQRDFSAGYRHIMSIVVNLALYNVGYTESRSLRSQLFFWNLPIVKFPLSCQNQDNDYHEIQDQLIINFAWLF
jgi:hypothetical protein